MDNIQRFTEIKKTIGSLSDQKIRMEERHKTERAKLETLVKEITAKGYDPQKLSAIRAEKEEALKKLLAELDAKVQDVSGKLNLIEV
jgi:Skp family chaperone for outer membrane proteins